MNTSSMRLGVKVPTAALHNAQRVNPEVRKAELAGDGGGATEGGGEAERVDGKLVQVPVEAGGGGAEVGRGSPGV